MSIKENRAIEAGAKPEGGENEARQHFNSETAFFQRVSF